MHTRIVHVVVIVVTTLASAAQAQVTATLTPQIDTFISEAAPTLNFGGGGGLTVGGPDSLDGNGELGGRFDAVMEFNAASAAATFDAAFPNGWRITVASITLTEIATPTSPLFPRGPGDVAVSWLSRDDWLEGVGTPAAPTVGSGGEATWDVVQGLRAGGSEAALGVFARSGQNVAVGGTLTLTPQFLADVHAGGPVTIQLTPATTAVGFTCNSRNFGDVTRRPTLSLTAIAAYAEGDANCDGAVDFFDIDPFLLALFDFPAWRAAHCGGELDSADVDDSGAVDFFDIDPFLAALFGG